MLRRLRGVRAAAEIPSEARELLHKHMEPIVMGDPEFKNFKQRGEWVEMVFMARASREGLQVSKPYATPLPTTSSSKAVVVLTRPGEVHALPFSERIQVQFPRIHEQEV